MESRISNCEALGKAIRQQRKALKLTQLQAAGLCGVGDRFLRELEQGKPTAELGKALLVLRGLGLHLSLADNRGS